MGRERARRKQTDRSGGPSDDGFFTPYISQQLSSQASLRGLGRERERGPKKKKKSGDETLRQSFRDNIQRWGEAQKINDLRSSGS